MRTFTIEYKDLDMSKQMEIEEEIAKDVKQDLIEEAKEEFYEYNAKDVRFCTGDMIEFMCNQKGYALDKNSFKIDFENLVEEIVLRRIRQNFISLHVMI